MAAIVMVVRPKRSARIPPATQPIPPAAITVNAASAAVAASVVPATLKLAARKSGTHVHIAKSSHMWPR